MTALILHPDPIVSMQLEQDYLAAGAMVFKAGNSPDTQHFEVSNPHHHSAVVYQEYNTAIFGANYSTKLARQAVASLTLDVDVVVCPEELTGAFLVGHTIADSLGIPVVKSVAEVFGAEIPDAVIETRSPAENYVTLDDKRFFLTIAEAELDSLSDESISILEKQEILYFAPDEKYPPGQPVIKRGAIVFPGGVV